MFRELFEAIPAKNKKLIKAGKKAYDILSDEERKWVDEYLSGSGSRWMKDDAKKAGFMMAARWAKELGQYIAAKKRGLVERMSVSKATHINTKKYEVVYALDGNNSDINIYDKDKEKDVVDEMEVSEKEVFAILKKYKIKA